MEEQGEARASRRRGILPTLIGRYFLMRLFAISLELLARALRVILGDGGLVDLATPPGIECRLVARLHLSSRKRVCSLS